MSAYQWTAMIVSILSIIAGFIAAIKFLVQHYLAELKPNSGSSLKDQVSRMELQHKLIQGRIDDADVMRKDMNKKLDHMYDILLEYIAKSK